MPGSMKVELEAGFTGVGLVLESVVVCLGPGSVQVGLNPDSEGADRGLGTTRIGSSVCGNQPGANAGWEHGSVMRDSLKAHMGLAWYMGGLDAWVCRSWSRRRIMKAGLVLGLP